MENPTSETIRNALLTRAKTFVQSRGSSFSAICIGAGVDSKFLSRVDAEENFSVKTYQRVMDWLDAQEAEAVEVAAE
jgi:hypothetical protein